MNISDLPSYQTLLEKCSLTSTSLVPPLNFCDTKILIVGEALGKDELFEFNTHKDEVGGHEFYFVGAAGRLLTKLLGEVGVPREKCHITNVIKVRPPDNKIPRLKELGLTIDDFLPLLREELEAINPTVIIPMGNVAIEACCGLTGITKWRGSEVVGTLFPGPRYFPTLHPSYIQRGQWSLYPFVRNDLKIASEIALGIYTQLPTLTYNQITSPSLDQAINYIRECSKSPSTVIDIETAHGKIRTVGLSKSTTSGISIPFRWKGFKNTWSYIDQCMILQELRLMYESPTVKIAHNAEYDFLWLYPLIGLPREPIFDTMRAHALVYPETPHTLGFVMSSHTDMPYHKDERGEEGDQANWDYNIKDCIGTHIAYETLVKELKEINMYEFFVGYTMPFLRLTLEMERVGIRVDKEMFEHRKKTTQKKAEWLQRAVNKAVGYEINVNSHKQIGILLYDEWKLPVQHHHKTKKKTVDQRALNYLHGKFPNRIFNMIMRQRHLTAKILGTYLNDNIIASDGHAHTSFGVTVTGRLSSRASDVFDSGTDLQNQPKVIRDIFIPDKGHVFTAADLKNAENRIQALVANMTNALRAFENGENVHLKVGEWIHERIVDIKTEPDIYKCLKNIQHGTNYGMKPRTFAQYIKKSVAEATVLQQRYLDWVPELKTYHNWVWEQVSTGNRTMTTPFGRVRTFSEIPYQRGGVKNSRLENMAFAHIPQSTVADIIDIGGLGLWLCLPRDCRMVLQIHDEWLVSVPPSRVVEFKNIAKYHLETLREVEWEGRRLTVPVEFSRPQENWRG